MKTSAYDLEGNRKYLNRAENRRFLKSVTLLPFERELFCLVIYYTGCRISEALNLKPENIEFDSNIISIRCLKKRGEIVYRRVPVPWLFMRKLKKLDMNGRKRIWNFSRTTGWRIMRKVMKHAGIEGTKACSRGLRHSFGVRSIMQRVPLHIVKGWMGHTKMSTTSIYVNVQGEEERKWIRRTWENPISMLFLYVPRVFSR